MYTYVHPLYMLNTPTYTPNMRLLTLSKDETVTFILPESHGENVPVSLVVTPPGGAIIESNVKRFTYSPPTIHLLTTEWESDSKDLLLITLRGVSFCKDTTCGTSPNHHITPFIHLYSRTYTYVHPL